MVRVWQIGNFIPSASTENHLQRAMRSHGWDVIPLQENDPATWDHLWGWHGMERPDFVLWTRTGWTPPLPHGPQISALRRLTSIQIPVIGYHLDRWWGLDRESMIADDPYFRVDLLVTADGGNDDRWKEAGVNHEWLPPAVLGAECEPGNYRPEYDSPVTFVGSHGHYHPEWPHRQQLVAFLNRNYRGRVKFWPKKGGEAIRGQDLRDLYASTQVVVGDSCLVPRPDGSPATRYVSDRCPESLGRGAFLLHPWVEGVTDGSLYTDGEHLVTWELGNWQQLKSLIDSSLSHPEERASVAKAGREHVLAHHTYERRVPQLLDLIRKHGLVSRLCPSLRTAREKLCVAQTDAEWPGHRVTLQECIDAVDRIGAFSCPDWSRFEMPSTELDA